MARVLIVDDEEYVREMLQDLLESNGHRVALAADGEEGLTRFRVGRPQVVITDLLMPRKGGIRLIQEIQSFAPKTKIIAMSGGGKGGSFNFLGTARTFEGVRTLEKPFANDDLLAMIDELTGEEQPAG